jgi:cobalt/nickel transport system permease protein
MHLGNGAITPECVALTYGSAVAGLSAASVAIRRTGLTAGKLEWAAGLGCIVLAAQAVNVPVAPGFSGHLIGGVLLATLLGPALGTWTMAVVLAIQAVLLGDGGVAAWGANVINMALLPAAMAALGQRLGHISVGSRRALAITGVFAAIAVPAGAALIVAETTLFRSAGEMAGWTTFAAAMFWTHAWIGLLEGMATVALVAAIAPVVAPCNRERSWRMAFLGGGAALAIAALLLPISSGLPDGYEAAAMLWPILSR